MAETPTPIKGYNPVDEATRAVVNHNKITEERILREMDALRENPKVDQRDLALARTYLENAFMRLNRAIMRPARIEGDL